MASESLTATLNRRLSALSPAEAEMVYLSAVPLWLDPQILIALFGSRDRALNAVRILERLLLLTSIGSNRAVIRPEARRYLLRQGWRGQLPEYPDANRRMANYCFQQLEGAENSEGAVNFLWTRAAMYHLLVAGEMAGWGWLSRLFDEAEARGQVEIGFQIVQPLRELRPILSIEDRATLGYYRARAALLAGDYRNAGRLFCGVITITQSELLAGVSYRGLGRTMALSQRWSEGLGFLQKSETLLGQLPDSFSLALTHLRIGELYQEMADFSGGILRSETPLEEETGDRLRSLVYLPNKAYRWLAHRIQRLPFLDVEPNYQNWAAARLMLEAAKAYRQAEKELDRSPSAQTLYEVRLGLLRMYSRVGMIRRAEKLLADLDQWEYVQESEYRRAWIDYWRADLARYHGDNEKARVLYEQVLQVFTYYQQLQGMANVNEFLGDIATGPEPAVEYYTAAADQYGRLNQSIYRTAVLNKQFALTDEQLPVDDGRRAYLSRFPERLAGRYRGLAFLSAGLLLLLGIILSIISLIISFIVEFNLILGVLNVFSILMIFIWPLLALWLFQVVNLSLGVLFSTKLSLEALEKDPPIRIDVSRTGLTIAGEEQAPELAWKTIEAVQKAEYQVRYRPFELVSYLTLFSGGRRWRIPAHTTGYQDLLRDLGRHIPVEKWRAWSFKFIPTLSTLLVGVLVTLAGGIIFQNILEIGGVLDINDPSAWKLTNISGVLSLTFVTVVLLYPLVIFWRLAIHVTRLRRATPFGYSRPRFNLAAVLIYLGAFLWSIFNFTFFNYVIRVWLQNG